MAQEGTGGGRFGLSPDQQRLAVIVAGGAVVLLLILFVLVPRLLGGGGGGTAAQPPLVRPRVTTTTLPAPAAPSSPGTFQQFQGKNPFTPLLSPASPSGGGTSATTAPSGVATGGGTGPGGTTGTTVAPGASGGAATAPRQSQRVALLNVYTKSGKQVADVRVNDTVYTAIAPGQMFASNYKLVSLQGSCGTFLFGDERFQLCKGEEVLK